MGENSWRLVALDLSRDGKLAFAAFTDGTVRIWNLASAKELCKLASLDGDKHWFVVTPDGTYDGSKGAQERVPYRIKGTLDLLPPERVATFHRSGLLAQIIEKGEVPVLGK